MSTTLRTLDDLFLQQLKDLYNAEQQITKALPKMVEKASSPDLKKAFSDHLAETENQITRITEVLRILGADGKAEKCYAMEGILKEGENLMAQNAEPTVMDAGLIASAQRVEHYEIAGYGTACTYAKMLGQKEVLSLLQETLDEEKKADGKLSFIAESFINERAANN
jgi:ferritin-like metal-binding protein YciE